MTYAKEKIYARLLNEKCKDTVGIYVSAEPFGFPDLIIAPYMEQNPITSDIIEQWGADKETVMRDAIANAAERSVLSTFIVMRLACYRMQRPYGAIAAITMASEIEEEFPNGYVIIPSSVHECIILDAESVNDNDINELINEVNASCLKADEVLSNHAYYFV